VVATVEFLDRDAVPAALTKDKKRIHEQEIAVHLAWQSTLYVTNFPESADDAYIRDIFGKVWIYSYLDYFYSDILLLVWHHLRRSMAEQEIQNNETFLLYPIHISRMAVSLSFLSVMADPCRRQLNKLSNCMAVSWSQNVLSTCSYPTPRERRNELIKTPTTANCMSQV